MAAIDIVMCTVGFGMILLVWVTLAIYGDRFADWLITRSYRRKAEKRIQKQFEGTNGPPAVVLESGDGIVLNSSVRHLHHKCCECGSEHEVRFEWRSDGLTMFFNGLGEDAQDLDKEPEDG